MAGKKNTISAFYWGMVLLAVVVAFSFQGSRGLYETTEGRYAEVAREMIETGNYLEPLLGYAPHWTKPPVTYWAIAGGIQLLGFNEWGVRFYGALSFILTVLLIADMGREFWDHQTGIAAGLIYASSILPVYGLSAVSTDMLLTLWETGAAWCFIKASVRAGLKGEAKWITGMWICFGLGFMTKGPPALLPLLPMVFWKHLSKKKVKLFNPLGILLFSAIGISWYLAVCARHPGLLNYFIGKEVVARVATGTFHRNAEWYSPFIIYLPALLLGAGFWSYFLVKTAGTKGILSIKVLRRLFQNNHRESFLVLWLILPLIVFFLAKSRLPLYVLPLYGPVALLIACEMMKEKKKDAGLKQVAIIASIAGLFLIGLKGIAAHYPHKNNMRALYERCRIAAPEAHYLSVGDDPLYGLQFYLDGNLARVSGKNFPLQLNSLEKFIIKDKMPDPAKPFVVISRREHAARIGEAMKKSGIHFIPLSSGFWTLYRIDGWRGISYFENFNNYRGITSGSEQFL